MGNLKLITFFLRQANEQPNIVIVKPPNPPDNPDPDPDPDKPELKITQQPVGFNGYSGGVLDLSVVAPNGKVFNLYKGDAQINQNTTGQYQIEVSKTTDSGSFYWIITDDYDQTVTSDIVEVAIVDKPLEVDADAQAYLTAEGITEQPYIKAVNDLVKGMKAANIFTKARGIYLYKGNTGRKNLIRNYAQYDMSIGQTPPGFDGRPNPFFDYNYKGIKQQYSFGRTGIKPADLGEKITIVSYNDRPAINGGQWEFGMAYTANNTGLGISRDQVRAGTTVFTNNLTKGAVTVNIYGTGSKDYSIYFNKTKLPANSDKGSMSVLQDEMLVGAVNFDGQPNYGGGPSTGYYQAALVDMVEADCFAFYDLMETFLTAYNVTPRIGDIEAFGDSITYSIGASVMLNGWMYKLSNKLNMQINNFGVSGTSIQQMIEENIRPYTNDIPRWFFINYGTNDTDTPVEQEKAYYRTKINAVLAKGWPKERIILNAGYYGNEARPNYAGIVQAILDIGTEYGIKAYDNRAIMSGVSDAFFHPGDNACEVLAEAYYQRLKDL